MQALFRLLFEAFNLLFFVFFFQAEDGIRDPLWSRGLGDVYKRQVNNRLQCFLIIGSKSKTFEARKRKEQRKKIKEQEIERFK